jgi:2-polyprenyl-3-methyl-5-hydroxy-6-metoxy-1,4-benzoquinol methylase
MTSIIETSPYSDSPRNEMLKFIPLTALRILDVGCHTGAFGKELKLKGLAEVWGIEPNDKPREVASEYLDKVLDGFFCERAELQDQYFDVIVFNDVLEHMPDPWAALKLAKKKLNPEGRIVISLPNVRFIENLIHMLKERDFRYEPYGIRDVTHLRFFTKKSIPRLFENSGLQIVSIEGINEQWWSPSILRRLAFKLFREYLDDTKYLQFAVVAKPL